MIKSIRHTLCLAVWSSSFLLVSSAANAQHATSFPIPSSTNDVGATPREDIQSEELEHIIVTGYVVPRISWSRASDFA